MGCAKSHLKWAEALRIRVVFGIRELLRRFWLLLGFKSNREILASRCSSRLRSMFISTVIEAEMPLDVHLRYNGCSSRRLSTEVEMPLDVHLDGYPPEADMPLDLPLRHRKLSFLAPSTFDFKTGYYPDLLRDLFEACSRIILSSSAFSEYVSNKTKLIIGNNSKIFKPK